MERAEMTVERERLTAEMDFRPAAADMNGAPASIAIRIRRRLPDFLQSVKLKYIKLGYRYTAPPVARFFLLFILPAVILAAATPLLWDHPASTSLPQRLLRALRVIANTNAPDDDAAVGSLTPLALGGAACLVLATYYLLSRPSPVYLVDFACAKPQEEYKISRDGFLDMTARLGIFTEESTSFQSRIAHRSGLGDETYLPRGIQARPLPNLSMSEARREAEEVMFGALDALFQKTGVDPSQISILVVNCSLFNPTPSLASMIVNHYKMREDIKSFNLGGMGCSAGLISVDLAKDMLRVSGNSNSYAVVLSMENVTLNWYFGNDRSMLLPNCIFRMGGAAVLLSNRRSDRARSKYELVHVLRTHKGADDRCYRCVYQREDEQGTVGVSLAKELMAVAGEALTTNITTLGPLVLPLTEQVKFLGTLVARKLLPAGGTGSSWLRRPKRYVPDFKRAFEHFCVHAGGRAVLDEVQKNLRLEDRHMEPSRMTLHRFGNTSSSSLWYELAYAEAKGRVARGDRVWQIAFGSGFKCNSAVWKALRAVPAVAVSGAGGVNGSNADDVNPWADCIHRYPVEQKL